MTYTPQKRSEYTKKQKRDEEGHFIPKKESADVKQTATLEGAAAAMTNVFDSNPKDDETLINVKVNNPLHRITKLLEEIKKHQATTISLRFTIPLIALPIALFVVFQLGRADSTCSRSFTTRSGVVRLLSLKVPKEDQGSFNFLWSFFPSLPKIKSEKELEDFRRTILIEENGEVTTVLHEPMAEINDFDNQKVLLTGSYSACTHTITLDDLANITHN